MLLKGATTTFTQIGLIVLVGWACKNAILIVEFARGTKDPGSMRHGPHRGLSPLVASHSRDQHCLIAGVFPW